MDVQNGILAYAEHTYKQYAEIWKYPLPWPHSETGMDINTSSEMYELLGHRQILYHLGAGWSIWGGKLDRGGLKRAIYSTCYLWSNIKERERKAERQRENEAFKSLLLFIAALGFAWKGAP